MKVAVTGGAGFLGSFLCEQLLEQGNEVIAVDNFFTGSKKNVLHLMDHCNFELIRHDIVHPLFLEVDQIYNMACPASPVHYQFNAIKTIKTNTIGMINMLGLAKRVKGRIFQASTSEVYGDPEVHPQPEEYIGHVNCLGPRSCYDEGKRIAESLMVNYHLKESVDIRIGRIFNTYGPRMAVNDGRVVSNFIIQALKNEPITIYGDGSQTRSFCFVTDLVEAIMKLMAWEAPYTGPINIGNPKENTIRELAEKVIELTGSNSVITYHQLPEDDPLKRQPDISKAKKCLNWQPTTDLEEGLKATIHYFDRLLSEQHGIKP
ncbi:MAG: NAD-dependent dehydratase [Acidobacteria bacterium]|nr:MAG: NAD-dependent dehydratase [Acidobacteriota bacterium]PIE89969.1 MAG: NAD-dependent dehydratase [Acidobacteriota bacterium]